MLVCNGDPPAIYDKLLKKNSNSSVIIQLEKEIRMDYSMGLFVYYFGTKKYL